MQTYNITNFPQTLIILLCTILIIVSDYTFDQKMTANINENFLQHEYTKIGGKEDYLLLKEIQKEEMLKYIQKLKEENPEYVYTMRQKAIAESLKNSEDIKILTWEAIQDLKKNSTMIGNTGALVSVIEFSDLECPYCIDFHNNKTIPTTLEKYPNTVNYSFKNFPLSTIHENAEQEALAIKCIEKVSTGENYTKAIDTIFATTSGGGTGYDLNNLPTLLTSLNIDSSTFNSCYSSEENLSLVKKEFEQGRKLGVNSTPSSVVINNQTGEHIVLSGNISNEQLEEAINTFVK